MRPLSTIVSCLLVAWLVPGVASAAPDGVQITMHDGFVSVVAQNATLPEILTEWARVGGTTILNAEKIQGARITLELRDVPEKEALAVLLRPVSGYLAVQRRADSGALSHFDRIVIMPTAPPATASIQRTAPPPMFQQPPSQPATFEPAPAFQRPPANPNGTPPGVQRLTGPGGEPVPDDQDGAPPFPIRAPQSYSRGDDPSPAPAQPPAATPAVGTRAPGMIVPAPAPAQPQAPPQQAPPAQPSR